MVNIVLSLFGVQNIPNSHRKLTKTAIRLFGQLVESFKVDRASLSSVADFLYCLSLWNLKGDKKREAMAEMLVERIDVATGMDVKELGPAAYGKLLFGLGGFVRGGAVKDVGKLYVWFDDRLNGYALLPRDVVRIVHGFAALNVSRSSFTYLLMKQSLRRSGHYSRQDARILSKAFKKMKVSVGKDFEKNLLIKFKRQSEEENAR